MLAFLAQNVWPARLTEAMDLNTQANQERKNTHLIKAAGAAVTSGQIFGKSLEKQKETLKHNTCISPPTGCTSNNQLAMISNCSLTSHGHWLFTDFM